MVVPVLSRVVHVPMSAGIVAMAFGAKARAEAAKLADNLWHDCELPLTVVGDEPVPGTNWRQWEGPSPYDSGAEHNFRFRAGRVKPFLHEYLDAERCLYLDTDCKVVGDLSPAFDLLERFDLLVTEHPSQLCSQLYNKPRAGWYHNRREAAFCGEVWGTLQVPYWNSGVIFWRQGEAAHRVFSAWAEEWQRFSQWDEQLALMRAAYANPCRLQVLPIGWNAPHEWQAEAVFHWYGRGTSRTNPTEA